MRALPLPFAAADDCCSVSNGPKPESEMEATSDNEMSSSSPYSVVTKSSARLAVVSAERSVKAVQLAYHLPFLRPSCHRRRRNRMHH